MKLDKRICHDCGISEGELHHFGCDMERCPFCFGQLISCDCVYNLLKIDHSPGTWTYSHGLTKKQDEVWVKLLNEKGRIPYISEGVFCYLCGHESDLWMTNDEEWQKFVPSNLQAKVLCRKCFERLKKLMPNGWIMAKEPSEEL